MTCGSIVDGAPCARPLVGKSKLCQRCKGLRSGHVRAAAAVKLRRSECDLRSTEAIFGELERLLLTVESSKGDSVQKVRASVEILREARQVLIGSALEDTYDELRTLVLEKWPQAAQALPPRLRTVR